MNTYKYVSSDEKVITIEFVIDGQTLVKRFDINYFPVEDTEDELGNLVSAVEAFKSYCENWIKSYKLGKVLEASNKVVSKELSDLKGKVQEVVIEESNGNTA